MTVKTAKLTAADWTYAQMIMQQGCCGTILIHPGRYSQGWMVLCTLQELTPADYELWTDLIGGDSEYIAADDALSARTDLHYKTGFEMHTGAYIWATEQLGLEIKNIEASTNRASGKDAELRNPRSCEVCKQRPSSALCVGCGVRYCNECGDGSEDEPATCPICG